VATLNKGDVHEFSLPEKTGARVRRLATRDDGAVSEGRPGRQYRSGSVHGAGRRQWLDEYRLATPSGTQDFVVDYASLVILTADPGSLLLNGVAVNTANLTGITDTFFSRGIVDFPNGLFTLDAAHDFRVMLGGGSNADSHFTFGGSTFAPGISPPNLR